MIDTEHRHEPRVARPFMVRYRGRTDARRQWSVSPLHDFSVSGARFMSDRSFIIEDELELELLLPVMARPIAIRARVAWTKLSKLGLVELGVVFDAMDATTQQIIEGAVAYFVHGEKGDA